MITVIYDYGLYAVWYVILIPSYFINIANMTEREAINDHKLHSSQSIVTFALHLNSHSLLSTLSANTHNLLEQKVDSSN